MVTTADVAIIGAGIVGASTALELSRRGMNVAVVDKTGGAGMGSTNASSAIIRFTYSTWEGVAASWDRNSAGRTGRSTWATGTPTAWLGFTGAARSCSTCRSSRGRR